MHTATASHLDPLFNTLTPVGQSQAFTWHYLSKGLTLLITDNFLSEVWALPASTWNFWFLLLLVLDLRWYVFYSRHPIPLLFPQYLKDITYTIFSFLIIDFWLQLYFFFYSKGLLFYVFIFVFVFPFGDIFNTSDACPSDTMNLALSKSNAKLVLTCLAHTFCLRILPTYSNWKPRSCSESLHLP